MVDKPEEGEAMPVAEAPRQPVEKNEIWLDMALKEVVTVIDGVEHRYKPDATVFSGYVDAAAYRQGNVNVRKSGK